MWGHVAHLQPHCWVCCRAIKAHLCTEASLNTQPRWFLNKSAVLLICCVAVYEKVKFEMHIDPSVTSANSITNQNTFISIVLFSELLEAKVLIENKMWLMLMAHLFYTHTSVFDLGRSVNACMVFTRLHKPFEPIKAFARYFNFCGSCCTDHCGCCVYVHLSKWVVSGLLYETGFLNVK